MGEEVYNRDFYKNRDVETRYAANIILEIIKEYYDVESVCDLGCGVGTWLNVAKKVFGNNTKIRGFDGDYVEEELLVIPKNAFCAIDLNYAMKGYYKKEKYDLAISLEVAEHLSFDRAQGFVRDLCDLSDVVLFSAATKLQGGDAHINEQRASYWVELFKENGYKCADVIRRRVWDDCNIQVWYRQNTFLFIKNKCIKEELKKYEIQRPYVDVIHPDLYESKMKEAFINRILLIRYQLHEQGWNISSFLRKKGIKTVAIYGMGGALGEIVYEDIVKTSNGDIEVRYFIDHYQKEHPILDVYDYTDRMPEVDAIIVTPIFCLSEIRHCLGTEKRLFLIDEIYNY